MANLKCALHGESRAARICVCRTRMSNKFYGTESPFWWFAPEAWKIQWT